ncbi:MULTISPECIES: hypothetical protein [unclassified Pseudomonas]|uniref:hypothetical protein n=1 Tax=unclassified Pseudomonas TaxID=196821 RepID=UPI002AC96B11|nr:MULTISPECIES: hypothetical protein [unclassified Pseudomonas]MEB0046435.1 hypothetical protein [Pseudomonas sp. Dout3]MEB0099345.1 hypothetical protein [Pseudomonas sp. DC1.2]WPX59490.1 hypothetical protein RHM68_02220 [Pseudomonas sp. DC1.2]
MSNAVINTAGQRDLTFGNQLTKDGTIFYDGFAGISRSDSAGSIITAWPYGFVKHDANGELSSTVNAKVVKRAVAEHIDIYNLAIQPDGKPLILTARGEASSAFITRFKQVGEVDSDFGNNGSTSLGAQVSKFFAPISGISILPGGDILLAFYDLSNNSHIMRLDSQGALINFGQGAPIHLPATELEALLVTADGFVVGGSSAKKALLKGFLHNGQPNPGFGTNGTVTLRFSGGVEDTKITGLAAGPNGAIAVAGSSWYSPQDINFVANILVNGAPDPLFNNGGPLETGAGIGAYTSVVVQADGKIVTLARDDRNGSFVNLIRHTRAGQWDADFGAGGVAEVYRDSQRRPETVFIDTLEWVQPGGKLQSSGKLSASSFVARLLSQ